MEFFEALQTYIIYTRSNGFEEIAGNKLSDEFFAYKEDGKTLYPEARWVISDIASGLALPGREKGTVLRFATIKDCKEWVKNIPEEYRQNIDIAKSKPEYSEQCQKLAEFKAPKFESFDFTEAFIALDKLYIESLDQATLFEF